MSSYHDGSKVSSDGPRLSAGFSLSSSPGPGASSSPRPKLGTRFPLRIQQLKGDEVEQMKKKNPQTRHVRAIFLHVHVCINLYIQAHTEDTPTG